MSGPGNIDGALSGPKERNLKEGIHAPKWHSGNIHAAAELSGPKIRAAKVGIRAPKWHSGVFV